MGQFDTGAVGSFASGMGLGLHALGLRQQHEDALARLLLAQQAHQDQQAYQQQMLGQGQQRIAASNRAQDFRQDQANQKTADESDLRGANADVYGQRVLAPQAGQEYMRGDHSDESFFQTAEGLTSARDAFAQMPSAAQKPVIQDTLESQRQLARVSQVEDIKRRAAEQIRSMRHAAVAGSSLPDDVKEKLHLKVDGVQMPMSASTPLTLSEWQRLPVRTTMDPVTAQTADQWVATKGQFPPEYMLKPPTTHRSPSTDPGVMGAKASVAMAQDQWRTAYAQHQAAMHELNGFMAMTTNKDALQDTTPEGKAKHEQAAAALSKIQARMQQATQNLTGAAKGLDTAHQAHIQSLHTYGQGAGAGPTSPRMTTDQAVAQAEKMFPNWQTNPEDERKLREAAQRLLGNQQAPIPAGNQFDDQRDAPDDSEPDPMDDPYADEETLVQ